MGLISPTLPTAGQSRATEEADVTAALQAILNLVNGALDSANLASGAVDSAEMATGAKRLFPQLVAALIGADHRVNWGRVTSDAFSGARGTATIAHGLGTNPAIILLTTEGVTTASGPNPTPVVASVTARDGTNITVALDTSNGSTNNSGTAFINWLAIT